MNSEDCKPLYEIVIKVIPVLSALIYFLGFIIFNAYLSTYGIYEFELTSFHYLKSGLIFFLVFIPVGIIVRYEIKTPTDNLSKNKTEVGRASMIIGYYLIIISYLLFRKPQILPLIFGGYMIIFMINTSPLAKNWPKVLRSSILIAPPILYCLYIITIGDTNQQFFLLSFSGFYVVLLFFYFDFGDKKVNPFSVSSGIISIIFGAALFGFTSFKVIPFYFGGPTSKKVRLLFGSETKKSLELTPIKDSLDGNQTKSLNVIYENEHFYYIHLSDSSVLTLNKSLFLGETSRSK